MEIAYIDVCKAFLLCCFQALGGVLPRGGREVVHLKVGVKGQQRVGDVRIEGGDKAGQASYFMDVDIAGHQQGAGNKEWWFFSLL